MKQKRMSFENVICYTVPYFREEGKSLRVNKTARYIGEKITENFRFPVWGNSVLIVIERDGK